jgi:hypothetical protein
MISNGGTSPTSTTARACVFTHKGVRACKKPFSLVDSDRKSTILYGFQVTTKRKPAVRAKQCENAGKKNASEKKLVGKVQGNIQRVFKR